MKDSNYTTRAEMDWYDFVHAKKVKEVYGNISAVQIRIRRYYLTPIITVNTIGPDDPIHLSVDCANPNCGRKFIITGKLEEALRTGRVIRGFILCDGQESRKPGAYGCLCRIDYLIMPPKKG